jgi:hypothetical protein
MMLEIAERDGSQGDKALEGAEGNGDNIQLAFFIAQHMTTGRMKCSVLPVICRDKSRTRNRSQVYRKKVVLDCDRRTTEATTTRAKRHFRHAPPDPLATRWPARNDPSRLGRRVASQFDSPKYTQPKAYQYCTPECESDELRV